MCIELGAREEERSTGEKVQSKIYSNQRDYNRDVRYGFLIILNAGMPINRFSMVIISFCFIYDVSDH